MKKTLMENTLPEGEALPVGRLPVGRIPVGRIATESNVDLRQAAVHFAMSYHGAKVVDYGRNGSEATFKTTQTGKQQFTIKRKSPYYEIYKE